VAEQLPATLLQKSRKARKAGKLEISAAEVDSLPLERA
jgi:hypothetical protein